jgi:hypothetical protein
MGTNGIGTFDDDDGMEWLDAFGGDGVSAVREALEAVNDLDSGDYLEATEATHALAAAELVAAARDGDTSRLPPEAVAQLSEKIEELGDARFVAPARRAVTRVLKSSELRDVWEDTPEAEEWEENVRELLERLKG